MGMKKKEVEKWKNETHVTHTGRQAAAAISNPIGISSDTNSDFQLLGFNFMPWYLR